ncbi:MAG TPA: ABC transporter ATP-binding protein [Pyrinomonadaceae bacterium]
MTEQKGAVGSTGLTASDLRKAFATPAGARLEVLRGASFSIAAGEMVAIVGASGSGKSTLLHILGGLEAADAGRACFGELELLRAGSTQLTRYRERDVGFVFQFHHLLPDLTAIENVALPLFINRRARDESLRRASAALEEVGLRERATHRIGQLSGGEQQRVAVARALVHKPRLVLADEPTGNLDAAIGDEIGASLARYCRGERALIVVATHNEQLAGLCDRVLLLRDGRLGERV